MITAAKEPNWPKKQGAITKDGGVEWQTHQLRPDMPEMPPNMKKLPVDKRGYPVPWFVDWVNGEPEFRAMDRRKLLTAIQELRCWVCGEKLWPEKIFVVGPMCAVNRISSEPPSHRECAQFSARACPFLSKPQMIRREDAIADALRKGAAGIAVERNPGVTLLWFTKTYTVKKVDAIPGVANAGILFSMGRPFRAEWYCRGRAATRAEVMDSIDSGLPLLYDANRKQAGDDEDHLRAELNGRVQEQLAQTLRLLPR